jgi:predicted nucleic acid-binding protein
VSIRRDNATINHQGHPGQILSHWRAGAFELVVSPPILDNLWRVLFFPRIRRRHGLADDQIDRLVTAAALGTTVTPRFFLGLAKNIVVAPDVE